jgi:hypothetical protein
MFILTWKLLGFPLAAGKVVIGKEVVFISFSGKGVVKRFLLRNSKFKKIYLITLKIIFLLLLSCPG